MWLAFPTTPTKECAMSHTLLEMAKDLVLAQIHVYRLSPEDMHTALQANPNPSATSQNTTVELLGKE
jgi:hypothetical protein